MESTITRHQPAHKLRAYSTTQVLAVDHEVPEEATNGRRSRGPEPHEHTRAARRSQHEGQKTLMQGGGVARTTTAPFGTGPAPHQRGLRLIAVLDLHGANAAFAVCRTIRVQRRRAAPSAATRGSCGTLRDGSAMWWPWLVRSSGLQVPPVKLSARLAAAISRSPIRRPTPREGAATSTIDTEIAELVPANGARFELSHLPPAHAQLRHFGLLRPVQSASERSREPRNRSAPARCGAVDRRESSPLDRERRAHSQRPRSPPSAPASGHHPRETRTSLVR